MNKQWQISFSRAAQKQAKALSERVLLVLQLLKEDLKSKGAFPGKNWANYGKLATKKNVDKRHCHLIRGNPTYVCCWQVFKEKKLVEVYYVGTHEKAPY